MEVLIMIGSPKNKGNSESIANYLFDKFNHKNLSCSKIYLRSEIDKKEGLLERINNSDIIVITFPVYENSVPGLLLEAFEYLCQNKGGLSDKPRKLLFISNSGFPEPKANRCAIDCCRLFTETTGLKYMGGFGVSPGTLVEGKKLEDAGGSYKKLVKVLDIISESIYNSKEIPEETYELLSKPLMLPFIYRFAGKIIRNRSAKKIGKEKYYARPLMK